MNTYMITLDNQDTENFLNSKEVFYSFMAITKALQFLLISNCLLMVLWPKLEKTPLISQRKNTDGYNKYVFQYLQVLLIFFIFSDEVISV